MAKQTRKTNRYDAIVSKVFFNGYRPGQVEVAFDRSDLESAAKALKIRLPNNPPDILYAARHRSGMPQDVLSTQPPGMEWTIEGTGRSAYAFRLVRASEVAPNPRLARIKVPDATPEIIAAYALSDEQALLAKVRYNRLIDIFLGVACFSLQNHLRTTVTGVGQIEIDEVYVGIDRLGRQYVIPVQAKGGSDRHSSVQIKQDLRCCQEKFPALICRAVAAQFVGDDLIALFELAFEDGEIRIIDEKHYWLVPRDLISADDLAAYRSRG